MEKFYIILLFITSFLVVLLSTPALIKVALMKRLFDEPDEERKLHYRRIPTIGGIIIFAATLFSFSLWYSGENASLLQYLVATGLLLFFVGVKDDIIGMAPVKKLLAHIIAAGILVLMANVRITSLHGLFGVYKIPEWASIGLSVFAYIVIVNAFNLIDGVDGLASGVGTIATLFFAWFFYNQANYVMTALALSLCGSLLGFLIFNFSPAKIFMGDSGSLTIGLFMSILAVRLVEFPYSILHPDFKLISKPIFALAILAYPLVDTLRVFIYRAIRGQSPFTADRNHYHHRFQRAGFSDKQTVLIIYIYSIIIPLLTIALEKLDGTSTFFIVFTAAFLFLEIPLFIGNRMLKKH
jgi:UDP-N-acetylmuramyl pentapeptide phosphotransferase/UDP-N-acetylglucosamine-1-phosphate transferase